MTSIKYYPDSLSIKPKRLTRKVDVYKGTIEPIEVFYKLLDAPPMECLLGYTIPATFDANQNTGLKSDDKKNPTHFYRYHDHLTGGGAIVYIPRFPYLHSRAFFKCIYVEPQHSKKGVATRCMEHLKSIADKVDALANKEDKYNGDKVLFNHFELSLCPTPFHVPNWTYEDNQDIDWGDGDTATELIIDGSGESLDVKLERIKYLELKEWYLKLGFVDAPYLDKHFYYDEQHDKIIELDVLTKFSNSLNRHSMIYPEKNLIYYDVPDDPGKRSALPI